MAFHHRMNTPIKADVLAVDIREHIWLQQCVVHRCIEGRDLLRGASTNLNLTQPAIPCLDGLLMDLIEIARWVLLVHIGPGVSNADEGDANLHPDHRALTGIER